MKWWRKFKHAAVAPGPPRISEQLAIDTLRTSGTERGLALADEIERGMRRRDQGGLHAHELSPNDAALLDMLTGANCTFGEGITLPSGRFVTGEEMYRWVGRPEVSE